MLLSGRFEQSWYETMLIMLPKSGCRSEVKTWRPIAILKISYKIFARLVHRRLLTTLDGAQSVDQVGFRQGLSVDDAFTVFEEMCCKTWEWRMPLWVVSVDLTKAFHRIEHAPLFKALAQQGVEREYLRLLSDLYTKQHGTVHGSHSFSISRGVKQGDVLSSLLFNAGLESALRSFKQRIGNSGIEVGAQERLTNVRYADDTVLYASSSGEAAYMLEILQEDLHSYGLNLNTSTTKILTNEVQGDDAPIYVEVGEGMLSVMTSSDLHKYLSKQVSRDLCSRTETNMEYRLQCAWGRFHANAKVLLNPDISMKLRLKMFEAVVTPTAVYGMATEALTMRQRERIEVTRRNMIRRMMGCFKRAGESWHEHGSRQAQRLAATLQTHPVAEWLPAIDRARWRFLCRICHDEGRGWPHVVLRWNPPTSARRRGRPKKRWTDSMTQFVESLGYVSIGHFVETYPPREMLGFERLYLQFMALQ